MGENGAPPLPYLSTRKPGRYAFELLCRWDGSVYKLVWRNLFLWLVLYYVLSFWYRFGMSDEQRRIFEGICAQCQSHNSQIPVVFVLGFYVATIVSRWWGHWDNLPWPDSGAFWLSSCIRGEDEQSRMLRRTVMRYLALTAVYTKCLLSTRVRKRFPTMDHFVEAGLMTEDERKIMENVSDGKKLYYLPALWAGMLVSRAKDENRLSDMQWQACTQQINDFRVKCSRSLIIEVQNVPVVYSQIAAWAVYAFSAVCLLGRQFVRPANPGQDQQELDMYFPILTVIELIFFWGWLKVAEAMIDPYGEDDADFPLNAFIDRNLQVSYIMADKVMHNAHFPAMVKDAYWDVVVPPQLPHTEESKRLEAHHHHLTADASMADVNNLVDAAAQIDGILSDVPTSVASWRDQEEKAWVRNMRRSTFRRVLGSLHHRHGSAAKKCRQLQRNNQKLSARTNQQLNSSADDEPTDEKSRHQVVIQPGASVSRQQLSPILENGLGSQSGCDVVDGTNGKKTIELAWTAKVMTSSVKSGMNASSGGFSSQFGFNKIDEESVKSPAAKMAVKRAETFTHAKTTNSKTSNWANFNNEMSPAAGRKAVSSGAIPSSGRAISKYSPVFGPHQQDDESMRLEDRDPSLVTCWEVNISSDKVGDDSKSNDGAGKGADEDKDDFTGETLTSSAQHEMSCSQLRGTYGDFEKTWPYDD